MREPDRIPTAPVRGYLRRSVLGNFYRRSLVPRGAECVELGFGALSKVGGVNLVLTDHSRGRVNVDETHEERLVRGVATELAAFLEVPLLDET